MATGLSPWTQGQENAGQVQRELQCGLQTHPT